jgi:hypothetical protein
MTETIGPRPRRRGPPAWIVAIVVFAAIGFVIILLGARWSAEQDCATRAENREDGRTMWLYLFDQLPTDDQGVLDARAYLDRTLPPLRCDGVRLIPVEDF